MNLCEELEQYAADNDILITKEPLTGMRAAAMRRRGRMIIAMMDDPECTNAERATLLAHELGHLITGALESASKPPKPANETEAWSWAIKSVLPLDELSILMSRYDGREWEIAEYVGVTEGFIRRAIRYYDLQREEPA